MLEIITKAVFTMIVLGTVAAMLGALFDRGAVERAGLLVAMCGVLVGILAIVWGL